MVCISIGKKTDNKEEAHTIIITRKFPDFSGYLLIDV
jgi:hypothetical protein